MYLIYIPVRGFDFLRLFYARMDTSSCVHAVMRALVTLALPLPLPLPLPFGTAFGCCLRYAPASCPHENVTMFKKSRTALWVQGVLNV